MLYHSLGLKSILVIGLITWVTFALLMAYFGKYVHPIFWGFYACFVPIYLIFLDQLFSILRAILPIDEFLLLAAEI